MKYVAILGRLPEISLAELRALFGKAELIAPGVAEFSAEEAPEIDRLGGSLKLGVQLEQPLAEYLASLPEGKITLGISDYSPRPRSTTKEAMQLKKKLSKQGRNVRVVQSRAPAIATATSHHNKLGRKLTAVEIFIVGKRKYISLGTQNIDAYARRDQARPARDAKVGMLPPKLAQILINLCGPLPKGARVLDPFCGTGVLLQEAALLGYVPYGTDIDERMVQYSRKNLEWLAKLRGLEFSGPGGGTAEPVGASPVTTGAGNRYRRTQSAEVCKGNAMNFTWASPIDAVACETYLGRPMSQPPTNVALKAEMAHCKEIIVGFLRNLAPQIAEGTPVTLAVPAWLRPDGHYERLKLLDDLEKLRYNGYKELGADALLYFREGQIVAREIITLRKK